MMQQMANARGVMKPGLQAIDRQGNLGERAYQKLRDSISRGAFSPGEKLTVRAIATSLGISTTPARDAINRLIGEGALVNSGPKTVIVPILTIDSLKEITAIRLELEGLAAENAAMNFSNEEIDSLEAIQISLGQALDESRYSDALRHNKEFRFSIYDHAKMPRLVAMIESLWVLIGPSFNNLYPDFAISRQGVANHMAAITGLREQDPSAVRAAIENDIRGGFRHLSRWLLSADRATESSK
jgi:DNA-binding GntR family transcriptional regulator